MYYEGLPSDVRDACRRTKHVWGFAKKLSDTDTDAALRVRDTIDVATRRADPAALSSGAAAHRGASAGAQQHPAPAPAAAAPRRAVMAQRDDAAVMARLDAERAQRQSS